MDGQPPFSEEDAGEITRIANTIFGGGFPPTKTIGYKKWNIFIELFLISVNRENGSFNSLPFQGGIFDQPVRTMKIFKLLGNLYRAELAKKRKKR